MRRNVALQQFLRDQVKGQIAAARLNACELRIGEDVVVRFASEHAL